MTQYGRPISDIATGSWSTATLYTKIDEATPNDADYIASSASATTCKFGLTSLSDPASASDHIISYRHEKGFGANTTTMYLYQGTTLIASQAEADTASWVTSSYTLSAAEANSITDYTDLRIWFTNSGFSLISWCEFQCPDATASTVTIPNTAGATAVTVNPSITGTALVTIPNTPDADATSITPTGIGVATIVTIPNTPNAAATSITPTSIGVTISLVDDVALVGTFDTNEDLTGTFIIDTALVGTFTTDSALDGTI